MTITTLATTTKTLYSSIDYEYAKGERESEDEGEVEYAYTDRAVIWHFRGSVV